MSSDQARIMMWSTPRSLSTAFARSMSSRGDTKIFLDPYLKWYRYGPERKVHWANDITGTINEKYTLDYIKDLLGRPHPDSKVLFSKNMIEPIIGNFDVVVPGYTHTFLIRHPLKAFRSYEKISRNVLPVDFKDTFKNIYQEMEKFYDHVTDVLGQSAPPVIDADDLQGQPEAVLSKYCELVGIPYTPKMLHWDSIDDLSVLRWECTDVGTITQEKYRKTELFSKVFESNGFEACAEEQNVTEEVEFSPDVRECAEHAMPVYKRLPGQLTTNAPDYTHFLSLSDFDKQSLLFVS